jgi:DNA-binding CsgD family transcriptional regulator/tetratricopeptide (TPR) repeat protein
MAALWAALTAVTQGGLSAVGTGAEGPATVLISGEAGVGKTRLVTEFTSAVKATVLTGPCVELGTDGLPFGPFTAMLRDLVRERGAGIVTGGNRAIRELARLLPELPALATTGIPEQVDPADARTRLFEGFLSLFEQLAAERPLVLLIEDAHWADRSSRDLLTLLVRYQRSLPNTLLLVTFRSDELHRTHPLRPLVAELDRIDWVDRMELPRLTRDQADDLAAAILGRQPEPRRAQSLYARAEGNPLFIEELLICPDGECDIPDSLRDLMLNTLGRLPEDTQEVLRTAAAAPSAGVSHQLLAAVTGRSDAALSTVIRPAVSANVLVTTDDGYQFRHALIREAVHDDLLPGEHSRVHACFAEVIDAHPEYVPPGRAEIEMAHHWNSAHDTTWALISAWKAATKVGSGVAYAEAVTLLTRVLELWDQVPDAAERIGADHVRVMELAADAAKDSGEIQRGLALVNAALKELDSSQDPIRYAMLLERRQGLQFNLGLPHDPTEALQMVTDEPSEARTRILLSAARCGTIRNGPQYRLWAQEALEFARQTGDRATEADALITITLIESDPGAAAETGSELLGLLEQARRIAREAGAWRKVLRAAISESHLLCGAGEYERAAEVARQGIADASQSGVARTSGTFLAINVAEPLHALGRWDEVLQITERALRLAPPALTRAWLQIMRGRIALGRGDLEGASDLVASVRSTLSGASYEDQYHLALAHLDIETTLATHGRAEAAAVATRVLDRYDTGNARPRYAWPLLVAARAVAHDEGLIERLRTAAEKLEVFGPVQRAGQLTFQASDEPSLQAWDAAAAAWSDLHQPHEQARALLAAAHAAVSGGDRDAAGERLRQALPLATSLGATPLAEQITTLARRLGVPLTDEPAASPVLGLTDREHEVLRLVAAGRSNKEIAEELFISPKTASVHVSNILRKIGAGSRTQAAAIFNRLPPA